MRTCSIVDTVRFDWRKRKTKKHDLTFFWTEKNFWVGSHQKKIHDPSSRSRAQHTHSLTTTETHLFLSLESSWDVGRHYIWGSFSFLDRAHTEDLFLIGCGRVSLRTTKSDGSLDKKEYMATPHKTVIKKNIWQQIPSSLSCMTYELWHNCDESRVCFVWQRFLSSDRSEGIKGEFFVGVFLRNGGDKNS